MGALKKEVQRFIVQRLACFDSPAEVIEACKAEFDIEISRQAVAHYDPTKGGDGKRLAEGHRELFYVTRKRFISEMLNIDIAHRAFRLRELSDLYHLAKREGMVVIAAQFLEQAAKEVGGFYVTRPEVRLADWMSSRAALLGTTKDNPSE